LKQIVEMGSELNREITSLESEKRMDRLALQAHQNNLAIMLNGSMGKDMEDVLSGKKIVKFSFWRRIKNSIDKFLWNLGLAQ